MGSPGKSIDREINGSFSPQANVMTVEKRLHGGWHPAAERVIMESLLGQSPLETEPTP